jgi:hypothetical protein
LPNRRCLYALSDSANDSRQLAARRKRARRLHLVSILNNKQVRIIHAARMDRYGDLTRPRSRLLNLTDRKRLGTAGLKTEKGSHGKLPFMARRRFDRPDLKER